MRNWDPPLPQLIDHHAVHIPTKHRSSQPPIKEKGKKRNMLLQTAIVQTFGPSLTALMNIGRKLGGFFVFAVAKEGQREKMEYAEDNSGMVQPSGRLKPHRWYRNREGREIHGAVK